MEIDDLAIPADDEPDDELVKTLTSFDELLRSGDSSLATVDSRFDLSDADEGVPVSATDCLVLLEQVFPRGRNSNVPLSGQQIGRFDLIRILGQGGFGTVYLARDPRLDRLVALKVPRLHTLGSRTLHERFLREARAAAALDHPHIVPILETGEVGPVCYIASAYCEGADLEQWLKSNAPVAPRLAARIVETLADATHYSHSRGILHRDLKPSNILMGGRDVSGVAVPDELPFVPRITDFGLARFSEEAIGETGSAVIGTPLYMAPEQATGQSDKVCAATDVYALGAILYELLTGRPPFQGAGFIEVLDQIRLTEPVSLARLLRSIPRDLETICLKCLAKEPTGRYATAQALHDDLRAFGEGRAITARPVGPLETAVKWARRRPLVATLAFVILAAVASVLVLQWRHSRTLGEHLLVTDGLRVEALEREAELRLQFNVAEINAAEFNLRSGDVEHVARRMDLVRKSLPEGLIAPPALEPEWNFVTRQLEPPPPERVFGGHEGPAYSVAVTPDGKLLASGDANGRIRIWELETGREVTSFMAHDGEVRALAFSPDGSRLASGGQFRQLKLWDTANWRRTHSVDAHDGTITCLDWRPDGAQIASGGRDGRIRLSQVADLANQQTLEVRAVVQRVRYSPDGSTLYSSDKGNSVSQWRLDESPPGRAERQLKSTPYAMDLASDGRFGLTAGVMFFSPDSKQIQFEVNYSIRAAVIAPRGKWAATGSGDGIIDLWRWADDPLQGLSRQRWIGHGSEGTGDLTTTPDGTRLITAGLDGLVKVWCIADFVTPMQQWLVARSANGHGVEFSRDDRFVASTSGDGRIRVYETRDGALIDTLDLSSQETHLHSIQFSADGATLFAMATQPASGLVVWQPGSSMPHRFIPLPGMYMMCMASRGAYQAIVFASHEGIVLWDAATETPVRTLVSPPLDISHFQLSPDGRWLAFQQRKTGGYSLVSLVEVNTGNRREIRRTNNPLNGLAFDREGRRLSIVTGGSTLKLIDVAAAEVTDSFHLGFASPSVNSPCFSPDGQVVAFGLYSPSATGGALHMYHLASRRTVLTLEPGSFGASHATFSHDGRMLACVTPTPDKDGNAGIFIWHFDPPRGSQFQSTEKAAP